MKKTLSVILVATLAVSSVVGVTAAVTKGDKLSADSSTSTVSASTSFETKNELTLPDVTGTWQHENNPYCTVQVLKQNGNKLDLMIESSNETYTKIATAKTTVTLDLWDDGAVVRGSSGFNFTDSFGNSGNGSVSVSENVISITIDEIVELGRGWSIKNATGDYIFKCDAVNPTATPTSGNTTKKELVLPDVKGTWISENNPYCSVQVYKQNGNQIDFMITSSNESYSKIASAKASVTLDLWDDGAVVRGSSDFSVTDSFGNSGTGTISVSENVISIHFDDFNQTNLWSVGNASGDYIFSCKDVEPRLR